MYAVTVLKNAVNQKGAFWIFIFFYGTGTFVNFLCASRKKMQKRDPESGSTIFTSLLIHILIRRRGEVL
jgi:hypothetical protein